VAGILLATAVPLCLLQVPYAALPQLASTIEPSAQVGGSAAVLRAASLALPFAVAFAPLGALAVRRFRALPVLLAGLIATVVGNLLTGAGTSTGSPAALGGALHGAAAGLTVVASAALVTERAGRSRRLLAAWWAAVVVAALAVLPGLTLSQHPASGWETPLGPVPWLTLAAVAALAAYALLASRPQPVSARADDSGTQSAEAELVGQVLSPDDDDDDGADDDDTGDAPAMPRLDGLLVIIADTAVPPPRDKKRRDSAGLSARPDVTSADPTAGRLGLLVPPALALGVVAVAATYRPSDTIVAAAVCGVAALLVMPATGSSSRVR
jgi:MFS family permease